jgi:DNA-binding transcriptional ArsR family regulator
VTTAEQYAGAPHEAPPMTGADDAELRDLDAESRAALAEIRWNERVAAKADDLRLLDAARARLRAEKVADTNFAEQYLDRAGLQDMPSTEPLIEKVLPRNAYAILRGRDHSFKSFVAIDWALCLATGKAWQGYDVEQCRVLYIAGEGAHGLRGRVDAWECGWARKVPPEMLTVRTTALNMHQPGPAFDHLLEHVTTGGYGLVIVDTLRRVSGSADGNSSEMGLVVDNLDQIKRATTEGTVLAVAHTDKGDHDTRGYSGIEDDADVVWSAKRDELFLTLELRKFKDGPDGRTLHLVAQGILDSLILSGTTRTRADVTNETQLALVDALREIYRDGATPAQLVEATGISKPTVARALNKLEDAGHVVNTGTKRRKYVELPPLPMDLETSETNTLENHHD